MRLPDGPLTTYRADDRTIWLVEAGCYADRVIRGAYRSLEAAKAAHPLKSDDEWRPDDPHQSHTSWSNTRDWQEALVIWPIDLEG